MSADYATLGTVEASTGNLPEGAPVDSRRVAYRLFIEVAARPFRKYMDAYYVADGETARKWTQEDIRQAALGAGRFKGKHTFSESIYVEFDKKDKQVWIDLVTKDRCIRRIKLSGSSPAFKSIVGFTIRHDMDHDIWHEEKSAVAFLDLMRSEKIDA